MTLPSSYRKSSYSANSTNCVEVRRDLGAVRDSKNPSAGEIKVSPERWKAFVGTFR